MDILRNLEHSVCAGDSAYDELKYNNSLAAEFPNYKVLFYIYVNILEADFFLYEFDERRTFTLIEL